VTGTAPTLLRTRLKSFSLEKLSIDDGIQQNHHFHHHHHMFRTVCTMCFSMVQTAIGGAIEESPILRKTDDHIGLV